MHIKERVSIYKFTGI